MMGKTHAATGVAAGVGATYLITLSVPAAVLGTLVCAGAALLPDIDHPRSTVSNMYGPVTRAFSWIMNRLTGGHRRGTHSIFGVAVLYMLAHFGTTYRHVPETNIRVPAQVALSLTIILALGAFIRLFKIAGYWDDVLPIPIVVGIVVFTDVPLWVVAPALALGAVVHIIGDVVTLTGCPIYWPFSKSMVKLGLFKTNGWVERFMVMPLVILCIILEIGWKLVDTYR